MIDVLKVIGRVILISFGLVSIGIGGLCTMIGSSSGTAAWVTQIGVVALLVGGVVVWLTFRNWVGKSATGPSPTDATEKENP